MNYGTLQSSIADFLNRQDISTSVLATFIDLCEADLNRSIRHRSMLTRATAELDTHFTQLPVDFLEAKNIQLNSSPVKSLRYVSLEQADLLRSGIHQTAGEPVYYTIVGDTLEVVPIPDSEYTVELTYYKRIPALSDEEPTNWLLTAHPDVYLYGSLMQTAPYLKDDERLSTWGPLYRQFIQDVNSSSDKAEYSGSALLMRTRFSL